jgi:hypothetical protein
MVLCMSDERQAEAFGGNELMQINSRYDGIGDFVKRETSTFNDFAFK